MNNDKKIKDIIRFHKTGKKKLILTRITEEQAKEWCSSGFTRDKKGKWFDGFGNVGEYCQNQTAKYNHYFIPDEQA